MTALTALPLTAATLATPALASAAPGAGDLAYVDFNVKEVFNYFGFRIINFKCSDYNDGQYPYVAFDRVGEPNVTYITGGGTHIGY